MKKLFFSFLIAFLYCISLVFAFGIAPSHTESFYEGIEQKEMVFMILNNDHQDMVFQVRAQGDLADYISFDNQVIEVVIDDVEVPVSYSLNLPSSLPPGKNTAEIIVTETTLEDNIDGDKFTANLGIKHKIIINVPYPDRYLEGILYAGEARPNEMMAFTVSLSNLGNIDIGSIQGRIVVKDPEGLGVALIETDKISLGSGKKSKIVGEWIPDVPPGTYHVEVLVEYDGGKVLVIEKTIDVGEPLIEIEQLRVNQFRLGTIAKFEVLLKNNWNSNIDTVYADTDVYDNRYAIVGEHRSSSVLLPRLGQTELISYWDTEGLDPGQYEISVKVNYLGRIKEKAYSLFVKENSIEINDPVLTGNVIDHSENERRYGSLIIIVLVCVLCIIMAAALIRFIPQKKKSARPIRHVLSPEKEKAVKDYIIARAREGISVKAIKNKLIERGWNEELVDQILLDIDGLYS